MEKRTLLAVILSLLVLYVYSGIVATDRKPVDGIEVYEIKQDLEDSSSSAQPRESRPAPSPAAISSVSEQIEQLESERLLIEFSNIGGNLKSVKINPFSHTLPVTNLFNLSGYELVPFEVEKKSRNHIVYTYEDVNTKITKSYEIIDQEHVLLASLEVTNKSLETQFIDFGIDQLNLDMSSLDNGDSRQKMLFEYSLLDGQEVYRKRNANNFSLKENRNLSGSVKWMGFRDQYFCVIAKPEFPSQEYFVKLRNEKQLTLGTKTQGVQLVPGSKSSFETLFYIGPQDIKRLRSYDAEFEKIVDFKVGGFFDIMALGQTDAIAKVMLKFLKFLHQIVHNWGVAIILFAISIYGLTYPLTIKSMSSMKKMQVLQPQLNKIREKYKNNPQKMQQEMMAFYKENKFNPFGGCLPILFQMPLFVSLYQLLWRSFVFKGASFLWIKDLSEPDRILTLPFNLFYFGNELNILPIFYGILMLVQQKFTSRNMVSADPSQAEMQKMMTKIFPIMLTVIFYKFASGLTLYFTTYFLLTTLSQWKMSKMVKA